ncbi:VOC family protein [Oceanispirochaeta sp.]|jgi:catechol 2,3-dioxygenase-like lactoylglutathione lyase family enzyme|uniref:VOC family protein n=1 Tax=Oceanispirochaeta sp. TaxID=2035350 RepID=UPI00262E5A6F|nr:VOC family protein [Oceanispirochaeta sp.]MDA3958175.1 VOC family protein [Oceanispirochaeta sp.]
MSLSLAHVCIKTKDLKKTEDFYCNGLGMEKVFDFTHKGSLYGFYLRMSENNFIEVFEDKELVSGRAMGIQHLCLETDNIDDMIVGMNKHGIETTEKKMGSDSTWQTWFKDPSGIDIELHMYTENSSQYTGRSVEAGWLDE